MPGTNLNLNLASIIVNLKRGMFTEAPRYSELKLVGKGRIRGVIQTTD